jgi:NADP-dependent 3-hydroxy acid dehydrogenase YdfG
VTGTLVVGAGPGLGRAIAIAFAATDCAPITLIARRLEPVTAIAAELQASGVAAEARAADVRDEPALREEIAGTVEQFGLPDVLVYNAAIIRRDCVGQLDSTQHEQAWGVNVGGALTAVAALAPAMERRGSGTILLTGGMPTPDPDYVSLSLGKAGVRALAELLAAKYGSAGVHVATVTVGGAIAAGTDLDPDDIAAHYVRLHAQPQSAWEREVFLPGAGG